MASGIPPLLPASPPPMCKDDFNEEEIDSDDYTNGDDDEFGNFSTAMPVINSSKPSSDVSISNNNSTSNIEGVNSSSLTNNKESFDITPVFENDLLREVQCDEQKPVILQTQSQEEMDEQKISSDSNLCISVSIPDETFPVPRLQCISSSDHGSIVDSTNLNLAENITGKDENVLKNLTCYNHTKLITDNQRINSPNLSDSGSSIDVPGDSFIICDELSPKHEPNALPSSENDNNIDSTFSEFQTNNNAESSISPNLGNCEMEPTLFVKVPEEKMQPIDAVLFEQNFDSEIHSSDCFFQPFIDVSASLPSDKVTHLDFGDVFQSKAADQSMDQLASGTEQARNENQFEDVSTHLSSGFDADDDDFSDFVSPTTLKKAEENKGDQEPSQFDNFQGASSLLSVADDFSFGEMCSFEQDTSQPSQTLNWTEIFCAPVENHIEVNVNTIEGKLNCSSVWCKIKDVETSPALHYNWNDSETNKLLLATLYVDSRNILFGPRWNSEVPRFASNLGFTPLVPEKASEKSPQNSGEFPDVSTEGSAETAIPFPEQNATIPSVPDAHFDWNNSGLTNPLDSCKPEKISVPESYKLQNSLSILNGSDTKTLSAETSYILNNLPDLMVMEKQYIVFPIR